MAGTPPVSQPLPLLAGLIDLLANCDIQGMEELIKQAFLHVDVIGPHVQEGHYDLIGPNGEIILPSVWEKVVEPDWAITMHMWPMDKAPLRGMHPGGPPGHGMPMRPGVHQHHPGFRPGMMPPGGMRPNPGMRPIGLRPGGAPPPPPGWAGRGHPPPGGEGGRARPIIVEGGEPRKKSNGKSGSSVLGFFAGKPSKSNKK